MDITFGLANVQNAINKARQHHPIASQNSNVAQRIKTLEDLVLQLAREVAKLTADRRG